MTAIRNAGRWVVDLLRAAVILRVWQVIGITVLAIGLGWLVWDSIQDGVQRDADLANYQTQLDVYATQREQRDTCETRVETRESYRNRFIASAESKGELVEGIDRLVTVLATYTGTPEEDPAVQELRAIVRDGRQTVGAELASIEIDLPLLDVNDCPPEPVPPTMPGATVTSLPTVDD